MYGLIGKMRPKPGERDALIAILLEGVGAMSGCLSYIVARDTGEADAIWITEVWDSEASHKASLQLPAVQAAIAKARPILAGFDSHVVTQPVGGHGLAGS
ncbi:putative quinol monooxygenase [Allosphingosinicella sp.]|uniref:putative quinol monooxygenase n=1 Tax=Allosphingosinicella sp. TaxID=2823234 RepID=UPI002FC1278A